MANKRNNISRSGNIIPMLANCESGNLLPDSQCVKDALKTFGFDDFVTAKNTLNKQ